MQIEVEVVPALAAGAAVFGGGGGGDPQLGAYMATHALSDTGPVDLVDLDDLDPEALVLPIAGVGAPTVVQEKILNGSEAQLVRQEMERLFQRPVAALMSAELGGLNGVLPVAWCANAGLPLADADLMGRAFPQLQMVTPHLYGHAISPVVLADERGNVVVFRTVSNEWAEKLVRSATVAMGGSASIGIYPMTVEQARKFAIRRSITRAIEVGQTLLNRLDDAMETLEYAAGARLLLRGKIIDVERRTVDGWAQGTVVVEGSDGDAGGLLRIEFQNENLVALRDGECVATVPDIITVVDVHTGRPVVTELLRYGQRVAAVALPCDPVWRSEHALEVVGPRAFGYDLEYMSVEQRS